MRMLISNFLKHPVITHNRSPDTTPRFHHCHCSRALAGLGLLVAGIMDMGMSMRRVILRRGARGAAKGGSPPPVVICHVDDEISLILELVVHSAGPNITVDGLSDDRELLGDVFSKIKCSGNLFFNVEVNVNPHLVYQYDLVLQVDQLVYGFLDGHEVLKNCHFSV